MDARVSASSYASNDVSRIRVVRTVAELVSSELDETAMLAACTGAVARVMDASRGRVVLCERDGPRVAFDSAGTATDGLAPDELSLRVIAEGMTIARSDDDGIDVAVPIRFGTVLLGAIVLFDVTVDLIELPLVESCALYLGVRLHGDRSRAATEKYAELAYVDALTGLANRRRFDEALAALWERGARDVPLALVMVDIDYFKAYNDTYGHQAGDLCLRQVARALGEALDRPDDVLARYGGEEFAAILPGRDRRAARDIAEHMRAKLAALAIAHGGSSLGRVSMSAGVAVLVPANGGAQHELIAMADAALYDAKIGGRNRVMLPGYHSDAPPAERVAGIVRTNAPLPLTRLIGRTREAADVRAALEQHRLVTLVGAGGIGKTRLAVHVARSCAADFAGGAWFVDLAPVTDPAAVVDAFAVVGETRLGAGLDLASLARALGDRHVLIVVDNCEHVVEAAARAIATLLRSCEGLRIVATSREPLGIAGELRYRLPLLSLPPPLRHDLDALERSDAVALFLERARAVRPLALDATTAPLVGAIVRRLDGIALAIELAAARLDGMTLETLSARLDQRFRLLSGGDRAASPRQQAMRATLDWSYDLLTEAERGLFVRLAVFAGSFTLAAATAICADAVVSAADVADLLAALARKSLVADDPTDAGRYTLLETVRAYARERVGANVLHELARQHAAYYAGLADAAGRVYTSMPTHAWLEAAERERPNYRAALEWSLGARNDVVVGARLATALAPSLGDRAADEGIRWLREALAALEPGAHPWVEAGVWERLAASPRALQADELRDAAERAVALYRTLDDRTMLAHALRTLAQTLWWFFQRDRELAIELALEAIDVARASGEPLSTAYALRTYALTVPATDVDRRRELTEESLALFRRYGNDQQIGSALTWISELEFVAGEVVRAIGYGRAALRSSEASGSRSRLETSAANLAFYAAAAGDWTTARSAGMKGLRSAVETRSLTGITWNVQALAGVAAGIGDARVAAQLLAFCDARCGTLHAPRQAGLSEEICARRLRLFLAGALPPNELSDALERGGAMSEDEAVALALAIEVPGSDLAV
jgi:diguanylate cyclase (GGDEF)-like protein